MVKSVVLLRNVTNSGMATNHSYVLAADHSSVQLCGFYYYFIHCCNPFGFQCLLYVALSLTHKIRHFKETMQSCGPDKNKQRL